MRTDGEGGHIRAASQCDRLRHAYRPPDSDIERAWPQAEPIDVTLALHEYLDTLQPAEPQDLVTVAAEDKNEG